MYLDPTRDVITIDELCEALSIGKNTAYSLLNEYSGLRDTSVRRFGNRHSGK